MAHFENICFYIGSSYSKYRLFTGFSIKIQVKKKSLPNLYKDLKLKKKYLMNFCATITQIKLI